MRKLLSAALLLLILPLLALALHQWWQWQGQQRALRELAAFEARDIGALGATTSLRILPLLEYYSHNNLKPVDAVGTQDEVFARALRALGR